jgi:hypothetical protein
LKDILNQLKHHSHTTRRDALIGLGELLQKSVFDIASILDRLAPLQIDPEPDVRRQAISTWKVLLRLVPEHVLIPFGQIIMAHTALAMTHIYDDIRMDSVKFLDTFVEIRPGLVLSYETNRLLANFLGLLGNNDSNPTSKMGSNKVRVSVLKSLALLLQTMLGVSDDESWLLQRLNPTIPAPILDNSVSRKCLPMSKLVTKCLQISTITPKLPTTRISIQTTDSTTQKTAPSFHSYDLHNLTSFDEFLSHMMILLVDVWMEAFPLALHGDIVHANAELATCHQVLELLNLLFRHRLTLSKDLKVDWLQKQWILVEKHLLVNLPLPTLGSRDLVAQKLTEMNLAGMSLVANVAQQCIVEQRVLEKTAQQLTTMLEAKLDSNLILGVALSLLDSQANPLALLKKVFLWDGTHREPFSTKVLLKWLIAKNDPKMTSVAEEWFVSIPRYLWQMETTDPQATRSMVVDAATFLRKSTLSTEVRRKFQMSMIPFYYVDTSRGPVFGPFVDLDQECQLEVLNLTLDACTEPLDGKLIKALVAVGNVSSVSVVSHLVMLLQERCEIKLDVHLGILSSLLLGYTSDELKNGVQAKDWILRRSIHAVVIQAIQACLQAAGKTTNVLMKSLEPILVQNVPIDVKIAILDLFSTGDCQETLLLCAIQVYGQCPSDACEVLDKIISRFEAQTVIDTTISELGAPTLEGFSTLVSILTNLGVEKVSKLEKWQSWLIENKQVEARHVAMFQRVVQ